MAEQEGVTKFQIDFEDAPPLDWEVLRELNAWRKRLHDVGLIAQDPKRYGGLGYGNISRRLAPFDPALGGRFAITGTQTSQLPDLKAGHYAIVTESYPDENRLVSRGPIAPSSEAMTHGMIYSLRSAVHFVIHIHSPAIWNNARRLALPVTDPAAAYGTPEMASEVRRLLSGQSIGQQSIFIMGGHEDGVIAFGRTLEEAGTPLLAIADKAARFQS